MAALSGYVWDTSTKPIDIEYVPNTKKGGHTGCKGLGMYHLASQRTDPLPVIDRVGERTTRAHINN